MISQPDRARAQRAMRTVAPVDYVVVGHRDTAAENETLRQELAEAHQRIANLSAQCHRNTERDRYRQHSIALNSVGYRIAEAMATDWLIADRDAMREVVEAAKAVRELWRYDAMAAAEPEIHAFVAAVDALAAKDGA